MRHNKGMKRRAEVRAALPTATPTAAPAAPAPEDLRPSPFGLGILRGLQLQNVYPGTADPARVAKDRARNKLARRSRRAGRAAALIAGLIAFGATVTAPPPAEAAAAPWVPTPGVQWQWQLSSVPTQAQLNTAYASGARAFDIDGDDATAQDVTRIHALGPNVGAVCYIDAGGWEDYRSDAAKFPTSVKGKSIDGWPSERWLDVRQVDVLKPIMAARVEMCRSKGFDAVEPDLLDGWQNSTGFPISGAQQITYNRMIADLAHTAGLSVAQKGDSDQSAALQPYFDWTLNEQCGQYNECAPLNAYRAAGKAVWIVEYSGTAAKFCAKDFPIAGAAAMKKNVNLTAPRTPCTSSKG